MIRKLCLLSIVLLALSAPSTASAYWPYWGGWGWGNSGYGLGFNNQLNYVPAPPYYSIYPPVYYSHQITARHYGASPFAWPAGFEPITYTAQGEVSIPGVDIIENPFVTPKVKQTSAPANEVKAVELANPFVATASTDE